MFTGKSNRKYIDRVCKLSKRIIGICRYLFEYDISDKCKGRRDRIGGYVLETAMNFGGKNG